MLLDEGSMHLSSPLRKCWVETAPPPLPAGRQFAAQARIGLSPQVLAGWYSATSSSPESTQVIVSRSTSYWLLGHPTRPQASGHSVPPVDTDLLSFQILGAFDARPRVANDGAMMERSHKENRQTH